MHILYSIEGHTCVWWSFYDLQCSKTFLTKCRYLSWNVVFLNCAEENHDIPDLFGRNSESAFMTQPRVKPLPMLGLGSSIATPAGGIEAEIVAVRTFDELKSIADQVKYLSHYYQVREFIIERNVVILNIK